MSAVEQFVDDDEGYLDWIAGHPEGFVINAYRVPSADYLILHRANCGSISGVPARGARWTADYVKICGDVPGLTAWARQKVNADPRACGLCTPPL